MKKDPAAYQATLRLRAVRTFDQRQITAEHTQAILEAGRWTGSSTNRQPWEFVVVVDPAMRAELADAGRYSHALRAAPLVVALVIRPRGGAFDTGRLAQNMMLAAAGLGIASCPVTLHREAMAKKVLAVPDRYRCRFAIAFGYPGPDGKGPRRSYKFIPKGRRPVSDMVHFEQYGS